MQQMNPFSFIVVVVLFLLAMSSYWFLESIRSSTTQSDTPLLKRHVEDFYAKKISLTTLSTNGKTMYRLNAETMQRFEDDKSMLLTEPAVRAFSEDQPEVTVTARRGEINGDISIINLYEQAVISRLASKEDPAMQASSSHFKIRVNDDIIETQQPVQLNRGHTVSYANGMIFNNTTRLMQLMGNVRSQIFPEEKAASNR